MRFFFITNSPALARFAVDSGVDRIFVDLESIGKVERQGHLNTVISRHHATDVAAVRNAVPDSELMVRLNPAHSGSGDEIDSAISSGADVIMLPMFRTAADVARFAGLIRGRCRLCLLVETRQAMENLAECTSIEGVDEVHIGLNDLSIDLKLSFMFSPIALGLVDTMARHLVDIGMQFGVGGLARVDEGLLPARLIIGEHVRLGSTAAILSRTFHREHISVDEIKADMDFATEVSLLRDVEQTFLKASKDALEANRIDVWRRIAELEALRTEAARRAAPVG